MKLCPICHSATHGARYHDLDPEPAPLTVEIDGRRWVERERCDAAEIIGNIVVEFEPAPLTLDDLARIGYEAYRQHKNHGKAWEDTLYQEDYVVVARAVLEAAGVEVCDR